MSDGPLRTCDCKVGRSVDAYALDSLDERIHCEQTEADASLRSLADFVNVWFLEAAIDAAGTDVAGDAKYLDNCTQLSPSPILVWSNAQ